MLKDKLKDDMKTALKGGDSEKRTLIGMVLSSVKNREVDKRSKLSKTITDVAELEKAAELTDEEVMEVIASEVKRRKDSIMEFEKGGRPELAAGEQKEIDALMPYLPAQLSDDVVRDAVKKAIADTGATTTKDMGKVIAAVMAKIKGQAEGAKVSGMVKEELSR